MYKWFIKNSILVGKSKGVREATWGKEKITQGCDFRQSTSLDCSHTGTEAINYSSVLVWGEEAGLFHSHTSQLFSRPSYSNMFPDISDSPLSWKERRECKGLWVPGKVHKYLIQWSGEIWAENQQCTLNYSLMFCGPYSHFSEIWWFIRCWQFLPMKCLLLFYFHCHCYSLKSFCLKQC